MGGGVMREIIEGLEALGLSWDQEAASWKGKEDSGAEFLQEFVWWGTGYFSSGGLAAFSSVPHRELEAENLLPAGFLPPYGTTLSVTYESGFNRIQAIHFEQSEHSHPLPPTPMQRISRIAKTPGNAEWKIRMILDIVREVEGERS